VTSKLPRITQGGDAITGAHRKNGGELGEGFKTRMSKATIPERGGGGGDQGVSSRKVQRVEGPELLHLTINLQDRRSFTEQIDGSNSTEQLLSIVNY